MISEMLRRSNFFVRSVGRNHPHSWACTNQTARERSPSPYARDQARDHRLSLRLGLEICIHQSDHDSFGGIFELTVRQRQPDLIKPADLGPDMLWLALDLVSLQIMYWIDMIPEQGKFDLPPQVIIGDGIQVQARSHALRTSTAISAAGRVAPAY